MKRRRATANGSLAEQPHKSLCGQFRNKKCLSLPACGSHRLGSTVPTAYCTFHRRRPPGSGPVAGEKQPWPRTRVRWAVRITTGLRRECRVDLFHHRRLRELRLSSRRKELRQLPHRKIDDLLTRFIHQSLRRTDNQFQITSLFTRFAPRVQDLRLLEHPLNRPLKQNRMFQRCDFPVKPEVDARNG